MNDQITFEKFGDAGILINWPAQISDLINDEVLQMDAYINSNYREDIYETVPTYHSLAVYIKDKKKLPDLLQNFKEISEIPSGAKSGRKNIIRIPVCYKPQFGPDLMEVSAINEITVSELIRYHTQPIYKVYFLGFLPGFPYLGGLDDRICTPRKKEPRKFIDRGSVAIGGDQTGIYTMDSPGGWNIIGRSPLEFFSAEKIGYSLLKPGDYVKFISITLKRFNTIKSELAAGTYKIQKEVNRD